MHDIAPILDIEIPVNSVDENLPTAVASLVMQAEMENKTLAECLEQRVMFFLSDFDDLKALYKHDLTRHLFQAQEGNLYGARISLDNLTNDLSGIHDKPSPANSAPRSTTRLSIVGGV